MATRSPHVHQSSRRADSAIVDEHAMTMTMDSDSVPKSLSRGGATKPRSTSITVTVRPPSPSLAERILIPDTSTTDLDQQPPTDATDMLADLLHSKFSHMSLERQDAPSLMDVFGSGLDRVSIRHLLPTHAALVKSALESTNLEYCTAIVTRIRKYLSMDRVPDAVDNVLALRILPRLTDLLGFQDVPAPLKYEVCWVLTNVAAGSSAQTRELANTPLLVAALVRLVAAPDLNRDVRVQALWCLGNIVGDGDHLKAVVVREGGVEAAAKFARERILHLRDPHTSDDNPARVDTRELQEDDDEDDDSEAEAEEDLNPTARIVAWFASNVSRGIRSAEDWPAIQPLVPILHALLTWPDLDTIVDAAWGLARVLQPIDRLHELPLQPGRCSPATLPMVTQLVDQLCLTGHESCSQSTAIRLRSPALRALTNLSTATDAWHIQLLVDSGAVPALYELVRASTPATAARLPRWDNANPRAFARDKIPTYVAKDALLVLANMVACTDVRVVHAVLDSAPIVALWYALLVAGLVPTAAVPAGPAFATRSGRAPAGAPVAPGVDVTLVREVAWALSNITTARDPGVMDALTRHVDVGDDWRQVLIAGIGAGTAAPADVLGLGVQMGLLVPRALAAAGGVVPPPPSVRRSAKSVAGTKKLAAPATVGGEEYEAITAEVREKCADALLNMAVVLAPAGWLTHEHVANIDRIMAYVAKTEGGTRGRYAEVRELVMVPRRSAGRGAPHDVEADDDDDDDEAMDMAGAAAVGATRGLEEVLGALSMFSMDEEQRAMAAVAKGKNKLGPFGLLPSKGEGLAHLVAEKGVHHVLVAPGHVGGAAAAGMVAPAEEEYVTALRRMSLTSMADQPAV